MPEIDLTRKTWAVFGLKEGGKSALAKSIAYDYGPKALYYDTLREVPKDAPFMAYKPVNNQDVTELETVITILKKMPPDKRPKMFVIDEANRFCPPKPRPLPQGVADMNDWCRHPEFDMSVGYIARRPVQLNSDLTEICDYLFIFQLGGKNDLRYLNDLRIGLGDDILELPKYHFALVHPNRTWEICPPRDLPPGIAGSDTRVNP